MIFKGKEVGKMDDNMEEDSQVSKYREADMNAVILEKNNTIYGCQGNETAVQCAGKYYYMANQYEQVPSEKLQYSKKGSTPTIYISSNHSACHSLYTSPKTKSGSAKVKHSSGARYEAVSGHRQAAAVDEKASCKMEAVYEQAVVYEKAVVYEQAAVYEKAATYETAQMYEWAVTHERAVMYEKASPSNIQLS